MFNVKALWWTFLAVWILVATYWHVCKIQQLCDSIQNYPLFLTEVVTANDSPSNLSMITDYHLNVSEIWQYAMMFLVTTLIGFFTGKSYESRKTRELRYKLNRVNREIKYHQSKI